MKEKIKFKLIRTFPKIFRKELRELVRDYDDKYHYYSDNSIENVHNYTLEDIIRPITNPTFLDYIRTTFGHNFVINSLTPKALLDNPVFVDYVAKKSPHCIINMPEELITDEYVELYVNYVKNNDSHFSLIENMPKKIMESEYIFNLCMEGIKSHKFNKDKIVIFLNSISHNQNILDHVLDEIKTEISDLLSSDYYYNRLNFYLLTNEKIIRIFLDKNISNIDYIPEVSYELAKKYIVEKMKTGDIYFTEGWMSGDNTNLFFKDVDFFNAFVKRSMNRYLKDHEDKYDVNETQVDEQIDYLNDKVFNDMISSGDIKNNEEFMRYLNGVNINIENLSLNNKVGLFKTLVASKQFSMLLLKMQNDYELFNYFLDKKDNYYISLFDINSFKGEVLFKVIELIEVADDRDPINGFIVNGSSNKEFLKILLSKALTSEVLFHKIKDYFHRFPNDFFSDVDEKIVIDFIDKYGVTDCIDLIAKFKNSKLVFAKVIESNNVDCLNLFDEEYFNEDTLNLLKDRIPFNKLKKVFRNNSFIDSAIKFDNIDELKETFYKACAEANIVLLLIVIRDYKRKGYNDLDLEKELNEELELQLERVSSKKNISIDLLRTVADITISGNREAFNIDYIINDKTVYYLLNIGNIESVKSAEYISNLPMEILEKINRKQFLQVIKLLNEHNIKDDNKILLAFNMYLSVGLSRVRDLLNKQEGKNYGDISEVSLLTIFQNINPQYCTLKQEGNGYVPEINEKLINIIFGANYKIKNTPIRNFLTGCEDMREYNEHLIQKINNDLTLTESEKNEKISALQNKYQEYKDQLNEFIDNIGPAFNEWDIIEEEFMKRAGKSKLKLKLNLSEINTILKLVKRKRNTPALEIRDEPLIQSDVFDYAGYDTQYTAHPEMAPMRAVELSRMMEGVFSKKFPNVSIDNDNYKLEIINPQDRELLSIGYKSACCFRPNGNADNNGNHNSLLAYCAKEEYGGGLKICDKNGKVLMFSPVLRNGNVLMIHSIETKGLTEEELVVVHEMLKSYANKTIKESENNGDDISFVLITDLHYLDEDYTEGYLLEDYKFEVYDPEHEYYGMYNNLDSNHMILGKKENATFEDIKYDVDTKSYEYPKRTFKNNLYITEESKEIIKKIDGINDEIVKLSNDRLMALQSSESDESYELYKEIRKKKQEYLVEYKKLLACNNGKDIFSDYKKVTTVINNISDTKQNDKPQDITECLYGADWYIVITKDGQILGDYLETGKQEYLKQLEFLKSMTNNDEKLSFETPKQK